MKYDSANDTLDHIGRVAGLIHKICTALVIRGSTHDISKLHPPEKDVFDRYTPLLKDTTYGSEEYKAYLDGMQPALKNHYAVNSHHPEHYENGINDMDLLDLVEMFCDWKAASERHGNGSIAKSIELNKERFGISDQLTKIFENTIKSL